MCGEEEGSCAQDTQQRAGVSARGSVRAASAAATRYATRTHGVAHTNKHKQVPPCVAAARARGLRAVRGTRLVQYDVIRVSRLRGGTSRQRATERRAPNKQT
jgi:hypothetical protein